MINKRAKITLRIFSYPALAILTFFLTSALLSEREIKFEKRGDGIFCSSSAVPSILQLLRNIERLELDENMMLKEDGSDIFVTQLMNKNIPVGCLLSSFEHYFDDYHLDKEQVTVHAWRRALHILFSQYGEAGAWPLPTRVLRKEAPWPEGMEINDDHITYIYNVWASYLLKRGSTKKRWAFENCHDYSDIPCRLDPPFQYVYGSDDKHIPRFKQFGKPFSQKEQRYLTAPDRLEADKALKELGSEKNELRLGICQKEGFLQIIGDNMNGIKYFELDKDMIFKEGNFGGRNLSYLLNPRTPAPCMVQVMTENKIIYLGNRDIQNISYADFQSGFKHKWEIALLLLFTRYGERGAWPLPNAELQRYFLDHFPNFTKVEDIHRDYLYEAWYEYLMENGNKTKRATYIQGPCEAGYKAETRLQYIPAGVDAYMAMKCSPVRSNNE